MNMDIIKEIEAEQLKDSVTEFSVGDTIRVHAKIKEGNRERIFRALRLNDELPGMIRTEISSLWL